MAILHKIDVACLAVLIGGIIGYIDLFPMIPAFIPFILECNALITGDAVYEAADLRVAIDLHPIRKQRVIIGIIRIILACVILRYDRINSNEGEPLFCGLKPRVFNNAERKPLIES